MKRALTITLAAALAGGSAMGQAYEAGDWILRAGATTVHPDTNSDDINLPGGLVAKADVDDDTQLGIIPAYMLTDSWAIEVLAATPFSHNIEAQGQGSINGTNLDAGSTKQLPPHHQCAVVSARRAKRLAALYRSRRELHHILR